MHADSEAAYHLSLFVFHWLTLKFSFLFFRKSVNMWNMFTRNCLLEKIWNRFYALKCFYLKKRKKKRRQTGVSSAMLLALKVLYVIFKHRSQHISYLKVRWYLMYVLLYYKSVREPDEL